MRRKDLLRGIGIGIIIGAGVMYGAAALGNDNKPVSIEQQIDEEQEKLDKDLEEAQKELDKELDVEEETTEATTEEVTTEEQTTEEETTEATTEEPTTEEVTTEEATTEEQTTEEAEPEKDDKKSDKASGEKEITVSSGMTSEDISSLLEQAGLVDSANEFNSWLISKGYDSNLHIGTFKIKAGSSNEDIAKVLTTQGE